MITYEKALYQLYEDLPSGTTFLWKDLLFVSGISGVRKDFVTQWISDWHPGVFPVNGKWTMKETGRSDLLWFYIFLDTCCLRNVDNLSDPVVSWLREKQDPTGKTWIQTSHVFSDNIRNWAEIQGFAAKILDIVHDSDLENYVTSVWEFSVKTLIPEILEWKCNLGVEPPSWVRPEEKIIMESRGFDHLFPVIIFRQLRTKMMGRPIVSAKNITQIYYSQLLEEQGSYLISDRLGFSVPKQAHLDWKQRLIKAKSPESIEVQGKIYTKQQIREICGGFKHLLDCR